MSGSTPALLFDLDGTLVDSVYQHVVAWQEALETCGIGLSVWRVHRRVGMSGGLLVNGLLRETGQSVSQQQLGRLQEVHAEAYLRQIKKVKPLPGARDLLIALTEAGVPWTIATSGSEKFARQTIEVLGIDMDFPLITRDHVARAKPDPDLFLAAAGNLNTDISASIVIGDSIWDMLAAQRAKALAVGFLSGGYGEDELERAGAYRVYQDPLDLLNHLDEIGIRIGS
jgi:HAD superfamily hydrolase (TIGR01509 family)